jgi:hypothetical protein
VPKKKTENAITTTPAPPTGDCPFCDQPLDTPGHAVQYNPYRVRQCPSVDLIVQP